jgi:hypothetical protein
MSTVDSLAKVTEWVQCGPGYNGSTNLPVNCQGLDDTDSFDDRSWDNPYDVAKGHRGYIDGDFIMVLYAWSPNWLANTVGHDNYNLYIRRSFDGGQTWTTTPINASPSLDPVPADVTVEADGTTTCEWMGPAGSDTEFEVCTDYEAGDFEQARNVSQLVGTRETVLDPRYSRTRSSICVDGDCTNPSYLYPDDERDPSKFFVVFETGDNTTVALGEAEPLDLYYSRASNWGDDYDLVEYEKDGETVEYFDWLEGSFKYLSGEASVTANPGGTFFYAVWNQETVKRNGTVTASDAWYRRVMYLDGDTGTTEPPPPPPEEEEPPAPPGKGRR